MAATARILAVFSASIPIPHGCHRRWYQQHNCYVGTHHTLPLTLGRAATVGGGRTDSPASCRTRFVNGVYIVPVNTDVGTRGGRWADGASLFTRFNTMMPPNGPSCMEADNIGWVVCMLRAAVTPAVCKLRLQMVRYASSPIRSMLATKLARKSHWFEPIRCVGRARYEIR